MSDKDIVSKTDMDKKEGETKVSPLSLHNLYSHLNISVKTLDMIIVGLVAALIIVLIISLDNRGFVIEFDSMGGSDVASQKLYYGDRITYEEPERQGYRFDGWSLNRDCNGRYDPDSEIDGSFKLYACWIGD